MRGRDERDVAHREMTADDELAALQSLVQDQGARVRALDGFLDGGLVALVFGRADQAQKCRSVACQSIQRSASARRQTSSGHSVPTP